MPRLYRRLAWISASLAFGLIVLGGIVRITGSGMGCGEHWPRCNGEWFPPLDLPTLIEIGHRWAAALVSIFVAALAVAAWLRHRQESRLRNPATLAVVLLVIQILLGAVTVRLALPPEVVIVHLGNAMVLLAVLIVAILRAGTVRRYDGKTVSTPGAEADSPRPMPDSRLSPTVLPSYRPTALPPYRLTAFAAVLGFAVVLLGALVANYHAGLLCQGFPLCNGTLVPPAGKFALMHWVHRMAAFAFLAYVIWMVSVLRRERTRGRQPGATYVAALAVLGLTMLQIGVAAAMVLQLLPTGLRALHMLVGTAVWAALVVLVWTDRQARLAPAPSPASPGPAEPVPVRHEAAAAPAQASKVPGLWSDLVTLTKPRVISLLLVTTVAPMFITGQGAPGFGLVLVVLFAGYLMAGGANAINMWFDRDIDDKMSRTRLRPLPSGRLSPRTALGFGIGMGLVAFAMFYFLATPLAAWLALAGLLFYVFVYTVWLKRSSPQNIVIGGAAGAFPPLVGWTAVTGRLDLMALYLFAIIFYWTPPHFWALALIKQGDYARAGVPMMPVVRGERSTKIQMLGYTIMLVPLTVLPWLAGNVGTLYLVAAVLLGARLLWYCVKLLQESGVTPTAWRMYRFSLLYLFLLFIALGVDHLFPTANPFRKADVVMIELGQPATHQH